MLTQDAMQIRADIVSRSVIVVQIQADMMRG
jgi:hypothetical protein